MLEGAPDLSWVDADLAVVDLGRTFDLVVLAGDVLPFVGSQAGRPSCANAPVTSTPAEDWCRGQPAVGMAGPSMISTAGRPTPVWSSSPVTAGGPRALGARGGD